MEHGDGITALIRLDLNFSESAVWPNHVILPRWPCGEVKDCLYTFADREDIEARVEERRIDVKCVFNGSVEARVIDPLGTPAFRSAGVIK